VQALFAKYDLDGNRVLDAGEQKLLEDDLKVPSSQEPTAADLPSSQESPALPGIDSP
jgi:hypothetical protein